MLTEHETAALNGLLQQYGTKGVLDGMATLLAHRAQDTRSGSVAEIARHDAELLRRAEAEVWEGRPTRRRRRDDDDPLHVATFLRAVGR